MLDKRLRDRYSRQTQFPPIGEGGQARLLKSTAVVVGCGALGCVIATYLVRAGVGRVRIVDRDFPETHNLQRQVLFDEADVKAGIPKAMAAERRLRTFNSTVEVKGIVADVNFSNVLGLCRGADVILDGLDTFETRFLLNDAALKLGIPWVYGGAVASSGMTMNVIPGKTACFRCIHPVAPPRGTTATCETAGVVGTVPGIIGAVQATEAIKILVGAKEVDRRLLVIDAWAGTFERMDVSRRDGCPACGGTYDYLAASYGIKATSLCGQTRAVQVVNAGVAQIDLDSLAARLERVSNIRRTDYLLRFEVGGCEFSVFPDGRAIIKNTNDEAEAEALYGRYVERYMQPFPGPRGRHG